MSITHATPAVGTDSGDDRISKDAWDEAHAGDFVSGASGTGNVVVPGFAGHRDRMPSSPSAYDDEFNAFSGWTTLGTLDSSTPEVTTRPSHLHLARTTASTNEVDGIYKTAPTAPFTVTCKLSETLAIPAGNIMSGILLTESSPGKLWTLGFVSNSGFSYWNDYFRSQWTNRTTKGTSVDVNLSYILQHPMRYLRVTVLSGGTTADCWVSEGGFIWQKVVAAAALNLTVANVGLYVGAVNATQLIDSYFDWIRFS